MVEKVISGGQTGIDRMGLEVARKLDIPTGGMAPKDFRTEIGPDPTLKEFGLTESRSHGYTFRTLHNVLTANGTVLFGDMKSPGSQQTIANSVANKKPYICNPSIEELVNWIIHHKVKILNVAGNRGSRLTGVKLRMAAMVLMEALIDVRARTSHQR